MSSNFVHLHNHSEYSLLDGLSKTKKMVAKAKELGMPAIALTDHGVMYGAIEFYKNCKKEEIKPLIGMEGYVVLGDHKKKEGKADKENNHLVLLARNYTGYKNLMKVASIAQLEGFYYRPRISRDVLAKYAEGITCLSACPMGEVGELLIAGNYEAAKKSVEWYAEVFGEGNYFLEVQRHFYKDYWDKVKDQTKLYNNLHNIQKNEDIWVAGITKLSRELGIPIVATNDSHYTNNTDAVAQDALVCIATGKNVSDIERLRYLDTPTFYLRSEQEMASIFPDLPDAISNTVKVAESIDVEIELGKWYFPHMPLPEGTTAEEQLRKQVYERMPERYPNPGQEIIDRTEFELKTIIDKGYAPYFLMQAEMVNFCNDTGIITNTRGSAAGSIVSFIMGITTVDPIRYLLPFERFLNPYRPSPPDIDLDIADNRREELIAYVTRNYGKDKVAQICTFGRMMAKASVRDVGRVLGHPYAFPDRISKLIPLGSQGFPMTLKHALEISPELKLLYDTDPEAKKLLELAQEIEGNARHVSVHAAGTVVSPTDMTDYTPLQLEPGGEKVITQYEMHACEDVGLVKFDILGIRNLSILGAARDIIQESRGVKIDLRKLPLEDKKVFDMLARGETMGVFQMGGSGMTKWLKELKPSRLEDLMIMIAIFRPGPMANIPEFIARKHGRKPTTYMHPKMEKFLDKSFGILVYQDDILFTALELAGYDWGSVDKFRKAIGKKIPEEMAKQHTIFVDGCQKHSGMTAEEAEKIWDLFVPFQGYGFNKAHAASYGIVSYQTAYLKAHYPVEYMTALLTAEAAYTDKVVEAVDECKRMGIMVLAPDINASLTQFTIEPQEKSLDGRAIRFGLSAIKNVGEAAIASILAARADGDFKSLTDFVLRVDGQKANRKVLESLTKAGALDRFGKRAAILAGLDKIREMGTSINKLKSQGQVSLFGEEVHDAQAGDNLPDIEEFEKAQKLAMEKELLGFYLTEHPHADKLSQIGSMATHRITQLYSEEVTGKIVTVGGIIESVRNVMTKNGNLPMCFCRISDLGKVVEAVVFPKTYSLNPTLWQVDKLVLLSGKAEVRGGGDVDEESGEMDQEITIIVETAVEFTGEDTVLPKPPSNGNGGGWRNGNGNGNGYRNGNGNGHGSESAEKATAKPAVSIYVPAGLPSAKLVSLNSLLQTHKGTQPANLVFANNGSSKTLPLPYSLDWNDDLKRQIDQLFK